MFGVLALGLRFQGLEPTLKPYYELLPTLAILRDPSQWICWSLFWFSIVPNKVPNKEPMSINFSWICDIWSVTHIVEAFRGTTSYCVQLNITFPAGKVLAHMQDSRPACRDFGYSDMYKGLYLP